MLVAITPVDGYSCTHRITYAHLIGILHTVTVGIEPGRYRHANRIYSVRKKLDVGKLPIGASPADVGILRIRNDRPMIIAHAEAVSTHIGTRAKPDFAIGTISELGDSGDHGIAIGAAIQLCMGTGGDEKGEQEKNSGNRQALIEFVIHLRFKNLGDR